MSAAAAMRWAYGALGAFLLVFAIAEMVEHGGVIVAAGVIALLLPDLTLFVGKPPGERGRLSPTAVPWYNAMHRLIGPAAVLLWSVLVPHASTGGVSDGWEQLLPSTTPEGSAGFTFGLAWCAHVCIDRALGYGLRTAEGWQRLGPSHPSSSHPTP